MTKSIKYLLISLGIILLIILLVLLLKKPKKPKTPTPGPTPTPTQISKSEVITNIIYNEFVKEISSSNTDFLNSLKQFVDSNLVSHYQTINIQTTHTDLMNSLGDDNVSMFNDFIEKHIPSYIKAINNLNYFIDTQIPAFNTINSYKFTDSSLNNALPKIKNCIITTLHNTYSYIDISKFLESFIAGEYLNDPVSQKKLYDMTNTLHVCTSKYPEIFVIFTLYSVFSPGGESSSQETVLLNKISEFIDTKISNSSINIPSDISFENQYTLQNFISGLTSEEFESFNTFLNVNNLCYPDISSSICGFCDNNTSRCQTDAFASIRHYLIEYYNPIFKSIDEMYPEKVRNLCQTILSYTTPENINNIPSIIKSIVDNTSSNNIKDEINRNIDTAIVDRNYVISNIIQLDNMYPKTIEKTESFTKELITLVNDYFNKDPIHMPIQDTISNQKLIELLNNYSLCYKYINCDSSFCKTKDECWS